MGESIGPQSDEDLYAECSDEEKYNPSNVEKDAWEPSPEDIKRLYEKLANGEKLEIQWKCKGRRSPTPERKADPMEAEQEVVEDSKSEEKMEVTEFDFDASFLETSNPITPRRTPGSAKPRSTKRVARLDKIMDDIRRHKKIEESTKVKERSSPRPSSGAASPVAATTPPTSAAPNEDPLATPLRAPLTPKGRMSPKKS